MPDTETKASKVVTHLRHRTPPAPPPEAGGVRTHPPGDLSRDPRRAQRDHDAWAAPHGYTGVVSGVAVTLVNGRGCKTGGGVCTGTHGIEAVASAVKAMPRVALICSASQAASRPTKPSRAEPRVCCQGSPKKYSPGTSFVADDAADDAGNANPGVVATEPGCPDHRPCANHSAVGKPHSCWGGRDHPALPADSGMSQRLVGGADNQVTAGAHPSGQRRACRRGDHAQSSQPPEQVWAQNPLRRLQ